MPVDINSQFESKPGLKEVNKVKEFKDIVISNEDKMKLRNLLLD